MKVLLLEDVYNLGRAGDIKKVANGYGRNYLIPQGLAVLATAGAIQQAESIREDANKRRALLNNEMSGVAEQLADVKLLFPARAGETGKLYGSVTTAMIAEDLTEKLGIEIDKKQIHSQPLRQLGMHQVNVRLTIDIIPEVDVVIYREGESPDSYMMAPEEIAAEASPLAQIEAEEDAIAEAGAETEAEIEAALEEADLIEETEEALPEAEVEVEAEAEVEAEPQAEASEEEVESEEAA
jgi:large subunit ribosomal protein L9